MYINYKSIQIEKSWFQFFKYAVFSLGSERLMFVQVYIGN